MSRHAVLWCLALVGCSPHARPDASERPPAASGERAAPAREESTPTSSWVRVRAPRDRALLESPARTLPGTSAIEHVAASFPLRVVRVHVQSGDEVEVGAPIVDVTSQEVLGAAAAYQSTSAGLALHDRRLAELRGLHDERVVSAERVYEIEARRAELVERQRAALATLRSAGIPPGNAGAVLARGAITLEASVRGVVRDLHAVVGEVHDHGQLFATIVSGSSMRVEARFAQALGDGFRFEFEDLRGRRTPLGDRPTRTLDAGDEGGIYVWFDVPASAGLPPDAPGHVHATPIDRRYLEVPVDALAPLADGPHVMRRRAELTTSVPVTVVSASGTSAIVSGDLTTDDEVAADGAALLVPLEEGGAE